MFFISSQQVHEEFNPAPPMPDYKSTTHSDFNREEFTPSKPAPTMVGHKQSSIKLS